MGLVKVQYPDPEPNGLATMMGGLIEANLTAHPERSALLQKRATYAIQAPDVDVAVSIRLYRGTVTIRNGIIGRPDVLIRANSDDLVGMSAVPLRFGLPDLRTKEGRDLSRKLLKGRLKVQGLLRHPGTLSRFNKLMSV
jgi:hypothetical protein